MEEIWKDIENYEGLYQVSNLGRIKSLDRILKFRDGRSYNHKGRILKYRNNGDGYYCVDLCKNGKVKSYRVNRLVACAFIDNPQNLPVVNHKDECKTNNMWLNLEWCTIRYNNKYSNVTEKMINANKKPVIQFTKNGEFVSEYESISDAGRETGIWFQNISKCCKNELKSTGGYKWQYK